MGEGSEREERIWLRTWERNSQKLCTGSFNGDTGVSVVQGVSIMRGVSIVRAVR